MEQIAIICGILGFFGGFLGLGIGIWAVIEVKALQKSTHAIQYVPVSESEPIKNDTKLSQEFEKAGAMTAPFDYHPEEVIL